LLDAFTAYLRTYLRPAQDPGYGDQRSDVEESGGGFQTGYLMRVLVNYLEEVRAAGDWQAYAEGFNYLSGLMEWNYHFGNFPYYFDARQGGVGHSDGSGLTLVDPQAWYLLAHGPWRLLGSHWGLSGRRDQWGGSALWRFCNLGRPVRGALLSLCG